MTATNHALAGATLGLLVQNPLVALPVAFLSHFVLDAIPHYGPGRNNIGDKSFARMLSVDALLCLLLVTALFLLHPMNWALAAACAFVATTPDLMWVTNFLRARRGKTQPAIHRRPFIVRMHAKIQWFEKPVGALTEIAWFAGAITLLVAFVTAA